VKPEFDPTTVQHRDALADGARLPLMAQLSHVLRHAEPAVGGSIAVLTGWLAATSHAGMPVLWLFCLVAGGVALWSGLRRLVGPVEIAARALTLLAAGYVLHTYAGAPGGAAGVFFFWLGLTTLYYVFVLKAPLGSLVAIAAVAEFTLAALWVGEDQLSSLAARGAFLLILPMLLAMKLGSLSRRRAARADQDRTDSSTALYNRSGLLAHGKLLLATCRGERRELTLAVFDCCDLLEARAIYGNRTSRKLVDSIVRKLKLLAGPEGLAARTGPTQFAVAMPMSREKAVQAIERVLGNPSRFELEGCKSEIVLVPDLMVEAIPVAGTVERMFAALCRGLARIREEEQLRQRYLQRERERHSRPMSIQPAGVRVRPTRAPRLDPDPVFTHQIPSTVPMPLPTR
jgi:GGDEF domain-containing protein